MVTRSKSLKINLSTESISSSKSLGISGIISPRHVELEDGELSLPPCVDQSEDGELSPSPALSQDVYFDLTLLPGQAGYQSPSLD